jgi:hypothetical protein
VTPECLPSKLLLLAAYSPCAFAAAASVATPALSSNSAEIISKFHDGLTSPYQHGAVLYLCALAVGGWKVCNPCIQMSWTCVNTAAAAAAAAAVALWGNWALLAGFAAILCWEEVDDLPHNAALSGWLLLLITGRG